jgi:hypothetical protein
VGAFQAEPSDRAIPGGCCETQCFPQNVALRRLAADAESKCRAGNQSMPADQESFREVGMSLEARSDTIPTLSKITATGARGADRDDPLSRGDINLEPNLSAGRVVSFKQPSFPRCRRR